MAGSLPGIPLSQQFDASGRLLRGCLLSIYAANTSTPQDSFQDSGLTVKHPWPLAGDGNGRLPMFYLADGAVHVRLTDSGGVSQFDYPSMLVIGPSSGGGGGGGVDPNAIFQTGDCMWLDVAGIRAGWVRDNGRTLGNGTSGASERANADAQALFIFVWQTYSNPSANAVCPVIGGLGANGLADFNAGKQITLPDKRGFSPGGVTDMGNADSLRLASVPFTQGNAITPGSLAGEARHTLVQASLPNVTLSASGSVQPRVSGSAMIAPNTGATPNSFTTGAGALVYAAATFGVADAVTVNSTTSALGSSTGHNNTPLTVLGTFYRKL